MTFPRRFPAPDPQAAGRQDDSVQALPVDGDVSVREFLAAGGLRGFSTSDMFPGVTG